MNEATADAAEEPQAKQAREDRWLRRVVLAGLTVLLTGGLWAGATVWTDVWQEWPELSWLARSLAAATLAWLSAAFALTIAFMGMVMAKR